MTKIKIVTDSSLTIEKELLEELDITLIPLSVMVDGKLYDDSQLQDGEFLELMKSSKNLPKTSQPPVGLFAEIYDSLAGEDVEILSIHLSHSLSGTVEAARQGASLSEAQVTVVDSGFADQAMKFQVVEAAKLAKSGADMPAILEKVAEIAQKTQLFIGVSTLENLVKGGRIGRVQGLLSSLLNIKVVMEMSGHTLYPVAKGRGSKIFNKWLTDFKADLAEKEVAELAISYSGQPDLAKDLAAELAEFVPQAIPVLETGSIIQTHTGEGAWAILVRYE